MKEAAFIGGNLNDATRVGDTVRRRAGPWTPAVHALLRFLESAGFEPEQRQLLALVADGVVQRYS